MVAPDRPDIDEFIAPQLNAGRLRDGGVATAVVAASSYSPGLDRSRHLGHPVLAPPGWLTSSPWRRLSPSMPAGRARSSPAVINLVAGVAVITLLSGVGRSAVRPDRVAVRSMRQPPAELGRLVGLLHGRGAQVRKPMLELTHI